PRGARLWLDGEQVDLSDAWPRAELLPVDVPGRRSGPVRLTLHLPLEIGHYPRRGPGVDGQRAKSHHGLRISHRKSRTVPDGPVRLAVPTRQPAELAAAEYNEERVTIRLADGRRWTINHDLLPAPVGAK
ncbi:MAG: hypothetical protein ACOC93_01020, partial [Planctomycetota bacterium]